MVATTCTVGKRVVRTILECILGFFLAKSEVQVLWENLAFPGGGGVTRPAGNQSVSSQVQYDLLSCFTRCVSS